MFLSIIRPSGYDILITTPADDSIATNESFEDTSMNNRVRRSVIWLVVAVVVVVIVGGLWYAKRTRASSVSEEMAAAVESTPPGEEHALTLDEEERQFLWEIEHHGNLLSQHGFRALANALRQADVEAVRRLLAPDFTGEILRDPQQAHLHNEVLDVVREMDSGRPSIKLDRRQFIARLWEYRRLFSLPPGVKISLMHLSPLDRGNLNHLWQGICQLRMWGQHQAGKPAEVILYCRYRLRRPTEENLSRGGWLSSCAITQSSVGRAERFLLREVAAERGIDPAQFHDNWRPGAKMLTTTGGIYLCDFDRDGWLDALITDIGHIYLYKGQPGGRFRNVAEEVGLPAVLKDMDNSSIAAAFADLDGDGWEDLILGHALYRNEAGKRFVNVTARTNLQLWELTAIAIADYDRDGRLDLYMTRTGRGKASSWLTGKSGLPYGNQLWRNKGNWQFEDVTAASGTDGGNRSTFTAVWLDADNDGWPDLYVPNEFGNGVLYHNQGDGAFQPQALVDHACDFGTMGVSCGDINNDGNIDLYCGNMYSKAGSRVIGNLRPDAYPEEVMAKIRRFVTGSQLHLNRGNLHFEQVAEAWQVADAGWAYGPALVDLDNDGWLDIHATAGYISRSRDKPDG
jgi:hypothetical protein